MISLGEGAAVKTPTSTSTLVPEDWRLPTVASRNHVTTAPATLQVTHREISCSLINEMKLSALIRMSVGCLGAGVFRCSSSGTTSQKRH